MTTKHNTDAEQFKANNHEFGVVAIRKEDFPALWVLATANVGQAMHDLESGREYPFSDAYDNFSDELPSLDELGNTVAQMMFRVAVTNELSNA